MDFVSIVLLGALNVPLLIFVCRLYQRAFFNDKQDFWKSLLTWSFDLHAFLDKEHRHNHVTVLFLSLSVACCILLMLLEYELAYQLVDGLRTSQTFHTFVRLF
jgi:hypothetical protein